MSTSPAIADRSATEGTGSVECRVEVADSIEACERLREPWLRLRERCGVHSPNTDPDRFLAVVGAMENARPHVVLFGSHEVPRAMIIGRSTCRRQTHGIGYAHLRSPLLYALDVVYEGLLTDGQEESLALSIAYIRNRLRDKNFDVVSFNHLRAEQAQSIRTGLRRALVSAPDVHWRFRLMPGDFAATLRGFSKKRRNELAREGRRLADCFGGRLHVRLVTSIEELDQLFDCGGSIAAHTYHVKLRGTFSDTPLWRAQLELEARRGALTGFLLLGGDTPIVFNIGWVDGPFFFPQAVAHLPQYSRFSPGKYLWLRVFEQCCAEGLEWVDYGFGDAEYKRIYGTECWVEQSVRLYGRTARATVAWLLDVAATRAASGLKFAAERLGILRRIKNAWRRRMSHDADR